MLAPPKFGASTVVVRSYPVAEPRTPTPRALSWALGEVAAGLWPGARYMMPLVAVTVSWPLPGATSSGSKPGASAYDGAVGAGDWSTLERSDGGSTMVKPVSSSPPSSPLNASEKGRSTAMSAHGRVDRLGHGVAAAGATTTSKVAVSDPPLPSETVTVAVKVPSSVGVPPRSTPVAVPVPVIPAGRPVTVRVSWSPSSSVAGTRTEVSTGWLSVASTVAGLGSPAIGASLTSATVITKVSLASAPSESSTVTVTEKVPPRVGVPLMVPLSAS